MKQAAFINYCQSMIALDTQILCSKNLGSKLEYKVKSMYFRQGLCHSTQNTSVFSDQYLRDGNIVNFNRSLLSIAVLNLTKQYATNNEYLIPLCDAELGRLVCEFYKNEHKAAFRCSVVQIQIDSRIVPCIKAHVKNTSNILVALGKLLRYVGCRGALATQDCLVYILVRNIINDVFVVKHENFKYLYSDDSFNFKSMIAVLKQSARLQTLKETELQSHKFYCDFIIQLLHALQINMDDELNSLSNEAQNICAACLNRLNAKLLVLLSENTNYDVCMSIIEFAFDEIVNILAVINTYSAKDVFAAIKKFIINNLNLEQSELPCNVRLAGSCMHVFNLSILRALNYLAIDNKQIKIYLGQEVYHEIPESWGIPKDHEHDSLVILDNKLTDKVEKYNNQVVDLMIMGMHENVNHLRRGFGSKDIHAAIARQLRLRRKMQISKQLIVILDVTMTNLADVHLPLILLAFSEQLQSGKMAILAAFSMNKYMQIGFDRCPAGIGADFYAASRFPKLNSGDQINGFEIDDPTPQMIAHIFRHAAQSINGYYHMVHGMSRYIHENIINKQLYNTSNIISIDSPYTGDVNKTPWSFVIIRFFSLDASEKYLDQCENFLKSIGINFRDGFGFNKSTYIVIETSETPIIRISIGPNASKQQYSALVNFILEINAAEKLKADYSLRFKLS